MVYNLPSIRQSDKSKPTICRMIGCHKDESMLHIVMCQKLKPFWDLVFNFITTVIGDPPPRSRTEAIIFNMWTRDHLGSESVESACALLRHAFGCFYNAFSKVDLEQKLFSTPLVFHKTLLSFRSAVLRYAQTIRILYLQRRYHRTQRWRAVLYRYRYTYYGRAAFSIDYRHSA